jgi:Ca2+-binding RTX toxin-like protein
LSIIPIYANGGDATGNALFNFEGIIGSPFDDTLTGNANVNEIHGGSGNDIVNGKGGADILDGGTGNDTLTYASSISGVTVNLLTGIGTGGDAQGDVITNFENIIGSPHSDVLRGDSGINYI